MLTKTVAENWVSQQSWLFWYWNQFTLGLAHIFFRNKTLLFVKIDSWNFQYLYHLSRISWSLTKVKTPEYLDYVICTGHLLTSIFGRRNLSQAMFFKLKKMSKKRIYFKTCSYQKKISDIYSWYYKVSMHYHCIITWQNFVRKSSPFSVDQNLPWNQSGFLSKNRGYLLPKHTELK